MASKVPTVLVTGATGFVATHIVHKLLRSGHRVRGTVRSLAAGEKIKPLKNIVPDAKYPLELIEADLLNKECWADAVKGCDYVLHTASPFPSVAPKDEQELIGPAVDGTLSVLQACRDAGGVQRVVLTSSVAAISGGQTAITDKDTFTEDDWINVTATRAAYAKSKALAEKAAWEFVNELPDDQRFELSVLNPCFIIGPVLCGGYATSMSVTKMLFERQVPALPHMNFSVVDVRDVAEAHIVAMTLPEAAGERHLLASHNVWLKDIADIYQDEFGPLGYNIPTWKAPYWAVRLAAMFSDKSKAALSQWGKQKIYSKVRMTEILGIQPRPVKDTLVDMAHSMVENGFINKTSKYADKRRNITISS